MQALELFGAAVTLVVVGFGMAFYEWSRIKAGRPIMKGSDAIQLYWMTYLSMFILGVTLALAAIIK